MFRIAATALIAASACIAHAASAQERDTNFSQYPGFAAYFAQNPPQASVPSRADRALLQRYRPRLFAARDAAFPIRFYEDYIAQGRLIDADGNLISSAVTRPLLNSLRDDPHVTFEHRASPAPTKPVMYGRVDRETFSLGDAQRAFTFLTWTAVFRVSGIGAGISAWKGAVLDAVGNLDDWHQLDHYTSVTLALDEVLNPVAAMFQQHNYRQTRIVGTDFDWPADNRIKVDIAARSNELYPHKLGRTVRRAVGFLSPDTVDYLVHGTNPPFRAADDITDPATEVPYELSHLAPSDAFYTFKGFLGEKRALPGRSGPPGADYNTLPAYKPLHRQMTAFHWRDGDPDYAAWLRMPDRGLHNLARRFARLIGAR